MQHPTSTSLVILLLSGSFCHAGEEHLIADRSNSQIIQYAEENGDSSLVTDSGNLWSVALDGQHDMIYGTDLNQGTIWKTPLSGGNKEGIYTNNGAVLRGLTFDYDNNLLYFLNSDDGSLNAMNLELKSTRSLANGLVRPNDMTLDAIDRCLYITDSGTDSLLRYDIETEILSTVFSGPELDGVWGIDYYNQNIFLSDFHTNGIYKLSLSDTNLSLIVTNQETPRGLCVDEHHQVLYWLEAEENILWKSALDGSSPQGVYTNEFGGFRDLASYESTDKDADLLSDAWENSFFGHLLWSGSDNPDGDELLNDQEYLTGTDPTNTSAIISIASISYENGPTVQYHLRTDPWVRYEIDHSPDLQTWSPLENSIEISFTDEGAGMATRILDVDPDDLLGTNHFFRVKAIL